ncbi:MAG: LacI family DNA-binding transcriptional regulator [Cellulomonas sp.]
MRDVAALAGVGIKTVSRVVNNEEGVSPALVERVRQAAQALSFQPNLAAGNLRRSDRRAQSIGLLLGSVANPFGAAIHRAVEDVAVGRGVAVFSASMDEDPARERLLVAEFTARRLDGLILTPTSADQSYLRRESETGTPIVLVDRPAVGIDADSVTVDNIAGAQQATAHLIAHHHRAIAYLGDLTQLITARQRHIGYLRALGAAGIPTGSARAIDDLHSEDAAEAAVRELFASEHPPTALFTSQNLVTVGAIRALRALGLEHTIAVVGFDDFQLADLLVPAVTVIAQDPARIGHLAAERLFARLGGDTSPPEAIVVPTRLILRGSGELAGPGRAS